MNQKKLRGLAARISAFGAAAAVASLVSIGSAGAVTASLSASAGGTAGSLPGSFNPAVSGAVAAQMAADGVHSGTAVTIFGNGNAGGLLASPQIVDIQFEYIGTEAGFTNQTWLLAFGDSVIFNNKTSDSGDVTGPYTLNVGSSGFVPFKFTAVDTGGEAVNGGPIAPLTHIALYEVPNSLSTIWYAFFDDGGAGPDADYDDVVLRITANCPEGGCRDNSPGPTPLPAAVWLFGSVLAGGAGFGRWRKRKAKRAALAAA